MSHLKIISRGQGHIHKYEDLKTKIYTYILTKNVFEKNIIPYFALIKKIPNISPASKFTQQKAFTIRNKSRDQIRTHKKKTNQ